jgi:hypothetical protein
MDIPDEREQKKGPRIYIVYPLILFFHLLPKTKFLIKRHLEELSEIFNGFEGNFAP